MTNSQEEAKKQYLEVLGYNGEIEFRYKDSFYHIEPDYNKEDAYNIWKFPSKDSNDGVMIAQCSPSAAILEEKAFGGKTILEIEGEMSDCILR